MAVFDEDRLAGRLNAWSNGRVVLVAAASVAVGFALCALFF